MDKTNKLVQKRWVKVFLLLILSANLICCYSSRNEEEDGKGRREKPIMETAKGMFSQPITWDDFWLLPKYFKTSWKQRWPCFPCCPNLDFRGGTSSVGRQQGKSGEVKGDGAATVKEAVVRSLDEGKTMVEASARSAAEMVDKTVKKLKKTLSGKGEEGL